MIRRLKPRVSAKMRQKMPYWRSMTLQLILLVLLWMMLWQNISFLSLTTGLLVAIAVTRIFFLPLFELSTRFNPWAACKYLVFFFWELILGSLQVSWIAIRPHKKDVPAIVAVPLHTRNDFILTMTALTISLIPGSVVVDIDRYRSTMYLHVLHAPTEKQQQKLRRYIYLIEWLLVQSIGSKEDLEVCRVARR